MKVLKFIELMSGVSYPKITTVRLLLKRPFVDVLSSCRSLSLLFFIFYFFLSGIVLFVLWENNCVNFFLPATCELVSKVELQNSLSRAFDCPLNWVFNPARPQSCSHTHMSLSSATPLPPTLSHFYHTFLPGSPLPPTDIRVTKSAVKRT